MFRSLVSRVVDAFVPDNVLCSMYLDAYHENGGELDGGLNR